ncbi:MAG: aspartate aminotransferase [Gammaproteobacteria bacterium]|jgi:aspartate aminotransferase
MSIVATKLSRIAASPAQMITALAMDLQRQGRDILTMSAGEPDFDTPEHIKRSAMDALERGDTKYAAVAGLPALREAVCGKLKRENGLEYTPQQTIICSGGKQVLYNALMASLDDGDEVIITAPYWVSYPDMVLLANGKPVIVDTDASKGFKLSPQALEAAITPRTKWLIINNPGNPTGAVWTAEDLENLAQVLRKHPHVWVMTDDIYEHILYDDTQFATMAQVAPDLMERTLTINGFSKAYCMTGWRIGYGAGPRELIDAMIKVQSQSTSGVSSFIQTASVTALEGDQSFIPKHNEIFQQRRDLALSILNQSNGLSCRKPDGAFYLYIDCSGLIGKTTPQGDRLNDDEAFAKYLLDSEGVAVVHGAAFGMSPFFRISYALASDKLEDACNRIQRACGALQ